MHTKTEHIQTIRYTKTKNATTTDHYFALIWKQPYWIAMGGGRGGGGSSTVVRHQRWRWWGAGQGRQNQPFAVQRPPVQHYCPMTCGEWTWPAQLIPWGLDHVHLSLQVQQVCDGVGTLGICKGILIFHLSECLLMMSLSICPLVLRCAVFDQACPNQPSTVLFISATGYARKQIILTYNSQVACNS